MQLPMPEGRLGVIYAVTMLIMQVFIQLGNDAYLF